MKLETRHNTLILLAQNDNEGHQLRALLVELHIKSAIFTSERGEFHGIDGVTKISIPLIIDRPETLEHPFNA